MAAAAAAGEEWEGFYVTLAFNSSLEYFRENHSCDFRVQFLHPVVLQWAWEVSYPVTWRTVEPVQNTFNIKVWEDSKDNEEATGGVRGGGKGPPVAQDQDHDQDQQRQQKQRKPRAVGEDSEEGGKGGLVPVPVTVAVPVPVLKTRPRGRVPWGYYSNVVFLLAKINFALQEAGLDLRLEYDLVCNSVKRVGDEKVAMRFDPPLQYALGTRRNQYWRCTEDYAPHPTDIRVGFDHLYVYTDVVSHQRVGGVSVPLLRTVPVKGNHGSVTTVFYNKPHYVLVNRLHIDSIKIEIKSEQE